MSTTPTNDNTAAVATNWPGPDMCMAGEWQRDGRGLWAVRRCQYYQDHGKEKHSFGAWKYNVVPPGRSERTTPHSIPVSTVQALIDQWRDWAKDHAEAVRQSTDRAASIHATYAHAFGQCAEQLEAALLASPSLSDAQRVQELERKLHHEGIEHSEAQERIIKLEAHAVELEREVARMKGVYAARQHDDTKHACDECENCGKLVMCNYHSLLSELAGRIG